MQSDPESLSHPSRSSLESSVQSTWRNPLPADEIARQQRAKETLTPGCRVEIKGLGPFTYAGIWDTMHSFNPAASQDLSALLPPEMHRYLRRDLRGLPYLHLPYTLLADYLQ